VELKGRSFIGSAAVMEAGKTFTAINPATNSPQPPNYYSASVADVDRAAQLATKAFVAYRRKNGEERATFLREIANGIDAIVDALVVRVNQEAGLNEARVRSEAGRTSFQIRMFADLIEDGSWVRATIDHGDINRKPQPKPDLRSMYRPLGPVAVFGASNFPLAYSVAGGDTASAFAAGNPVIVKAHPAHPGTSEMIGDVILAAARATSMPDGVFSLLFDAGTEIGTALVKHPLVRAVGFTGSQRGGRALMDLAAARPAPIPVFAEMGSTNPVFLLPHALAARTEEIAKGMSASVTLGAGQFCTKPGLIFMNSGVDAESFAKNLTARIADSPTQVMLTPGIHSAYMNGAAARGKQTGVAVAAQGKAAAGETGVRGLPTLFSTTGKNILRDHALSEELFGPESVMVNCTGREEMLEIARGLSGHLTATVHGTEEDLREYAELIDILEQKAGRLVFNGFPTGVEVNNAIVHGGPYPATSDGQSTSVGTPAIHRFARPVCYQNFPQSALPDELKEGNPLEIWRLVDGNFMKG